METNRLGQGENLSLYKAMDDFHNQSNLVERNDDALIPQLSSVREDIATNQSDLGQIFRKIPCDRKSE